MNYQRLAEAAGVSAQSVSSAIKVLSLWFVTLGPQPMVSAFL